MGFSEPLVSKELQIIYTRPLPPPMKGGEERLGSCEGSEGLELGDLGEGSFAGDRETVSEVNS